MRLRLLAFASAADALGRDEIDLDLPEGGTLADLRARLDGRAPGLSPLWPRLAIAVNGRVVSGRVELREGDEVALLPPVSGGSSGGEDAAPPSSAVLIEGAIDPAALTERVAGPSRGAVVLFLGNVRDSHAGRPVEKLTYSAYEPMARAGLARIVAELEAAHPDLRAAIVHRLGEVPVGEASVGIAVASPHRPAAYEASRTALERLKAEVPIWKREHYADGEAAWREEEALVADQKQR